MSGRGRGDSGRQRGDAAHRGQGQGGGGGHRGSGSSGGQLSPRSPRRASGDPILGTRALHAIVEGVEQVTGTGQSYSNCQLHGQTVTGATIANVDITDCHLVNCTVSTCDVRGRSILTNCTVSNMAAHGAVTVNAGMVNGGEMHPGATLDNNGGTVSNVRGYTAADGVAKGSPRSPHPLQSPPAVIHADPMAAVDEDNDASAAPAPAEAASPAPAAAALAPLPERPATPPRPPLPHPEGAGLAGPPPQPEPQQVRAEPAPPPLAAPVAQPAPAAAPAQPGAILHACAASALSSIRTFVRARYRQLFIGLTVCLVVLAAVGADLCQSSDDTVRRTPRRCRQAFTMGSGHSDECSPSSGFHIVRHEEDCRAAALYLSVPMGEPFRSRSAFCSSLPVGCYYAPDKDNVFWNACSGDHFAGQGRIICLGNASLPLEDCAWEENEVQTQWTVGLILLVLACLVGGVLICVMMLNRKEGCTGGGGSGSCGGGGCGGGDGG
eukprot:TRINITY_DN25459_c0_g1_i1.p1 TRINITY_DN25459_c0_g1~~TRINITY_DN25459_c0_g1_i1.p1  ORF type:complete len:494 (+),score=78.43 TRINITY_DN25459_c0_g1_i1:93-1574(+)